MKKFFVVIAIIIFSCQFASSWEGIGVNLGGGLSKFESSKNNEYNNSLGGNCMISFNIPLKESGLFEFELGYIRYWFSDSNNKIYSDGTPFYQIRIFFTDKEHFIRPNIHIGACTLPFFSWSLGAGLEFKFSNNIAFQILGSYFIDFTRLHAFDEPLENGSTYIGGFHPECLIFSIKYNLD
ncbi:MAG: hypothetical protein V1779_10720 [bacterium]